MKQECFWRNCEATFYGNWIYIENAKLNEDLHLKEENKVAVSYREAVMDCRRLDSADETTFHEETSPQLRMNAEPMDTWRGPPDLKTAASPQSSMSDDRGQMAAISSAVNAQLKTPNLRHVSFYQAEAGLVGIKSYFLTWKTIFSSIQKYWFDAFCTFSITRILSCCMKYFSKISFTSPRTSFTFTFHQGCRKWVTKTLFSDLILSFHFFKIIPLLNQ